MIYIKYGPLDSVVTGDDKRDLHLARTLLAKELTYEVPGYFFMPLYRMGAWDGRKTFFNIGTGKFPSGLLSRVLRVLSGAEFEVDVSAYPESQSCPTSIRMLDKDAGHIDLYDYQVHAVSQALRYSRGIWKVATNGGKTEVTAATIQVLGHPPAIVLVPRLDVLEQTRDRLQERLGQHVGICGGGKWEPNETGTTVCMFQTAYKRRKTAQAKRWFKAVAALFIDECHFLSDKIYQTVVKCIPAPIRIGMSGTPFKESPIDSTTVLAFCGPVLCVVGNLELIERGISVKPKVLFLEPKVPRDVAKLMELQDFRQALQDNQYRNELIGNLGVGFVKSRRQTVIMVQHVEHGKAILACTPGAVLTYSQAPNRKAVRKRLAQGDIFCCICTSIFDTGLSVDYMEALIMAGGGKSAHSLLQRLGRLLRKLKGRQKDIWCVDFWDTFNKITRDHSRDRFEIFKGEKAFTMMEDVNALPIEVLTEIEEGAGVNHNVVKKSRKRKWVS